jgi:hypothetical protein
MIVDGEVAFIGGANFSRVYSGGSAGGQRDSAPTAANGETQRPWRDTHVAAGLSLMTNPDFNLLRPDYVRGDLQWRQLIGPVIAEAGGRAIHYRADANRAGNATRSELWLRVNGEWWWRQGRRIEARAEVRRDLQTADISGGIELRFHWGSGRQFHDFGPNDIDFRALRRAQAPAALHRIEEQ